MNKFVFGAIAVVALLCIFGLVAVQSNTIQQAVSPDKAKTPVTNVKAEGSCGGCCSGEKSALVSTESAKSSCCEGASCCAKGTTEVAAKAGCCGGCSKTELASTSGEAKVCDSACQDGDANKCCQLAKKEGGVESNTEIAKTSEETEGGE